MSKIFEESLRDKSTEELYDYFRNRNSYHYSSLLAVANELIRRGEATEEIHQLKAQILSESGTTDQVFNFKIPDDLPDSISWASKLLYATALLGLINPMLVQFFYGIDEFIGTGTLFVLLFVTIAIASLAYYVNLGKKWPRIVFLVLFVIGLPMTPESVMAAFSVHAVVGLNTTLQSAFQLVSLILLFNSSSNNWYANLKKD